MNYSVQSWRTDPSKPSVQVPGAARWMDDVVDMFDEKNAIRLARRLATVYVNVRVVRGEEVVWSS